MPAWEPFTEPARRAIVLAQESANRRNVHDIGADDIFLAALNAGQSPASEAAASLGVTSDAVRQAERLLPSGAGPSEEMVFTPEARRLIERAFEEARELGHAYIGAEHLLLAYMHELHARSALLDALNLDAAQLRAKIVELTSK
jgi:ATP-dependent Clp protease ATP-binding subunit ClpC